MFYQGKRRIIENITRGILVGEREISIEFSIREGNSCTESEPLNTISSTIHHSFFHRNSHKSAKKNYPLAPRTIGEHLRKKRIDLGLTQAELGKILKVTPDCITFWENNRSEPQIKYYPSIYRFLGYHPIIFDETNFRERLRKYRYLNGVSFRQMGLLLKIDASTVRAWELGHNSPSTEKIKELNTLLAADSS